MADQLTLRREKLIACSAEAAYDAFVQPEHLVRWFTTQAEADLRPGGRYSNGDGDNGEFLELERPRRLRFTWENAQHCPGTVVSVSFEEQVNGYTQVVLEHSLLASDADLEDMRGGWSWALDSYKSYLETGKAIKHEDWLAEQAKKQS